MIYGSAELLLLPWMPLGELISPFPGAASCLEQADERERVTGMGDTLSSSLQQG